MVRIGLTTHITTIVMLQRIISVAAIRLIIIHLALIIVQLAAVLRLVSVRPALAVTGVIIALRVMLAADLIMNTIMVVLGEQVVELMEDINIRHDYSPPQTILS